MCGICGIVSFEDLHDRDFAIVSTMSDSMVHRGPDASGQFRDTNVAFGVRRLSIIDIEGGRQPITNEDNSIVLIANGEIYNYVELRNELRSRGHSFKTGSDCETIVHLYEEFGPECLTKLRGMFAFALWDGGKNQLFLARDRIGEKPLYLWQQGRRLVFASELRALIKARPCSALLDPAGVDLYMHYQYVPEPATIVRGVRKLQAGHYLLVRPRSWDVVSRCYWNLEAVPLIEDSDPAKRISQQLDEVTSLTLRSDVPVGIALSGGVDSSVIAALSAHKYKGRLAAFTVGYEGRPQCDERDRAKIIADKYDLPLHEIEITSDTFVESFPELVASGDDPIADIAAYGYSCIFKEASKCGVPVMLTGFGGDELFWGYPWVVDSLVQNSRKLKLLGENQQAHRRLARELTFYERHYDFKTAEQVLPSLYSSNFSAQILPENRFAPFRIDEPFDCLPLRICRVLFNTWLVGNCIALGDRLSMTSSVELRLPLLDYKLVELVLGLRKCYPMDFNLGPKAWLKEAAAGIVPEQILSHPKTGFTPPVQLWADRIIRRYGRLLTDGYLVQNGIFDADKLRQMLAQPLKGTVKHLAYKIVILEIWCRSIISKTVHDWEKIASETQAQHLSSHISSNAARTTVDTCNCLNRHVYQNIPCGVEDKNPPSEEHMAVVGSKERNNVMRPVSKRMPGNIQSKNEFAQPETLQSVDDFYYGQQYFDWQKDIGSFGGRANLFKFADFIKPHFSVIDFGCGGGYLLRNIQCRQRLGIEINACARKEAEKNSITTFESVGAVPDNSADVIISNHALEHVENPLEILKALGKKLKDGGRVVFVVPHQDIADEYSPSDKNRHLYTWNRLTLGNLFAAAGYGVLEVEALQHQWPSNYREVYSRYGEEEFHRRCREYAARNNNYQIRIVAEKNCGCRQKYIQDVPVILVCYNRPRHTAQVLEALKRHNVRNLYVFADASKSNEDAAAVAQTRQLLYGIDWTEPKIIERPENFGLAKNIVSAVNHVFEKHDRLILLEDDCVPQEYFFDFMHTCLDRYEHNKKVFGISGYTVNVPDQILSRYPYDLYFCPRIGSWGWATWKDRWQHRGQNLHQLVDEAFSKAVDLGQGGTDIPVMVEKLLHGEHKDIWTLNWVLSVYLNDGVYIYPTRSHILNVGMDGTGVHCGATAKYDSTLCRRKPANYPQDTFTNAKIMANFRKYYDIPFNRVAQRSLPQSSNGKSTGLTVGFISANDIKGGAQRVGWMLKKGLDKQGYATRMFVGDKFSDDPDVHIITDKAADSAKDRQIEGYLDYDIRSTFTLASTRKFESCDVIHFHNLHRGYFNPFALPDITKTKPSVWTLHDMYGMTGHCAYAFDCDRWQIGCGNCPNLESYPPITKDVTAQMWRHKKNIYEQSDFELIVPSLWLKRIVEKSILKDKKVHLIYNGIDGSIYRPRDKDTLRRKFKIPADAVVLGFVAQGGLIDKRKGGDFILAAYKYLVPKYKNVVFLCIGGKSGNAPTERFIQTPFILDENLLAELYCLSDVFIFPTLADNCPLVILEMMGCGVPVVSFKAGGVPELIEHNKTGLVADYKDTRQFIQFTEQLVLDKAKRERFSQAGLDRFREIFTLQKMIDTHICLYEHLAEEAKTKTYVSSRNKIALPSTVGESKHEYLVSAIVSTYNSERFIRGCLENLENQTIADKLEIIVVNSGSQQNEEAIVKEFQQKYNNIRYIKTEQREGIYSAWNRAVKVARGKYITNANTDDRHRTDAFEIMAKTLDENPAIALVYGDQIRTDTPNDTFEDHHGTGFERRADYSHQRLLFGCCVGSQPMWRKSLHDELGYFDETLTCAGDWDFWLRISEKYDFKHIPDFLGLYYHNAEGIEHGNKIHSLYERYIVGRRYGTEYISVIPYYKAGPDDPLVSVIMPVYNGADYIAAAIESVLIQNYPKFELIIVDDGSTDNTKQVIDRYRDERIRYVYKQNGGLASAINHGIRNCSGEFVIKLDADDMITPDFVVSHLSQFRSNPDVDMVYCDDLLIDEQNRPIRVIERPKYAERNLLIRDLFRCGFPVVPFRTCIKKSVFDKIGLYDEMLQTADDYDMMRRFVKHGLKIHHLKGAMYLRKMTSNSMSRTFTPQKAKHHFDVVKRFADTFSHDQLFPDVQWDKIPAHIRQLHARCLTALSFVAIGKTYLKPDSITYAKTAFAHACTQLDECLRSDPENKQVRQLLSKCRSLHTRCENTTQRAVKQSMLAAGNV